MTITYIKNPQVEKFKKCPFLENLDLELMNDLENSANNLIPETFSQAELDICVEKLSKLFIDSAKTTFGIKRSRNMKEEESKVSVSKNSWSGLDCKFARQNYRTLKSRYKRNKTEMKRNKIEMKKAEKEYKRLLDTSIVNNRKDMRQKTKELR